MIKLPEMEAKLHCGACGSVALRKVVPMNRIQNPLSRSRSGNVKFMGDVILADVRCPNCSAVVVQLDGIGRGVRGSVTIDSVKRRKDGVW